METIKRIVLVKAKRPNRRIYIELIQEPDKAPFAIVATKRLVDAKSRHILKTENVYSIETFMVLTDLFNEIVKTPEVTKAINPYSKFKQWVANIYIPKD